MKKVDEAGCEAAGCAVDVAGVDCVVGNEKGLGVSGFEAASAGLLSLFDWPQVKVAVPDAGAALV